MIKQITSFFIGGFLVFGAIGAEKTFKDMNGHERYQALKSELMQKFEQENPASFEVIKTQTAAYCAEKYKNSGFSEKDSIAIGIDLTRNVGMEFANGKFIKESFEFAKQNPAKCNLVHFYAHKQNLLGLNDEDTLIGILDAAVAKRYSGNELTVVVMKAAELAPKVDGKDDVIKAKLIKCNRYYSGFLSKFEEEYTPALKALRTLLETY